MSAYHPQTDGQCERCNATLINMLGTLPERPKCICMEQVPTLVHAYNCIRNNVTDFSPYYLMFGRKPHLHINILFGTNTTDLKGNTSNKYVENLKHRFDLAYRMANEVVTKEKEWNKWHYDCKVRCTQLKVGDKVYIKMYCF